MGAPTWTLKSILALLKKRRKVMGIIEGSKNRRHGTLERASLLKDPIIRSKRGGLGRVSKAQLDKEAIQGSDEFMNALFTGTKKTMDKFHAANKAERKKLAGVVRKLRNYSKQGKLKTKSGKTAKFKLSWYKQRPEVYADVDKLRLFRANEIARRTKKLKASEKTKKVKSEKNRSWGIRQW